MTSDILRAALAIESAGLAMHNVQILKKKRIRSKDLVRLGATNIVGASLLREQAQFLS